MIFTLTAPGIDQYVVVVQYPIKQSDTNKVDDNLTNDTKGIMVQSNTNKVDNTLTDEPKGTYSSFKGFVNTGFEYDGQRGLMLYVLIATRETIFSNGPPGRPAVSSSLSLVSLVKEHCS